VASAKGLGESGAGGGNNACQELCVARQAVLKPLRRVGGMPSFRLESFLNSDIIQVMFRQNPNITIEKTKTKELVSTVRKKLMRGAHADPRL
jgi:hypothetical protein